MKIYLKRKGRMDQEISIIELIQTLSKKKDYVFDAQIGFVDGILRVSIFYNYNIDERI